MPAIGVTLHKEVAQFLALLGAARLACFNNLEPFIA